MEGVVKFTKHQIDQIFEPTIPVTSNVRMSDVLNRVLKAEGGAYLTLWRGMHKDLVLASQREVAERRLSTGQSTALHVWDPFAWLPWDQAKAELLSRGCSVVGVAPVTEEDAVIEIYRAVYGAEAWESILKIDGWPAASYSTHAYIAGKCMELTRSHGRPHLPGGVWLNNGFTVDETLPDWTVRLAPYVTAKTPWRYRIYQTRFENGEVARPHLSIQWQGTSLSEELSDVRVDTVEELINMLPTREWTVVDLGHSVIRSSEWLTGQLPQIAEKEAA